jgi:hypothetical protein
VVYLIFILVTLVLLIGFFVLTVYETERTTRLFAEKRTRLDASVTRAEFILTHVDLAAFLRDEVIRIAHRTVHDVAHFSLLVVRATERALTRLVRYLRTRRSADIVPNENPREFVKTLSDFKDHLEETRPEVPDILNRE